MDRPYQRVSNTSDDQDIGDIEAVSRNFIVVKKGLVNVHRYYIPLHGVEGWDGKVVWLKIPEEMVKTNYERDPTPDPHDYHYSSALWLMHQTMCADSRLIYPKSSQELKKKDHFLFLSNPQNKRSAS